MPALSEFTPTDEEAIDAEATMRELRSVSRQLAKANIRLGELNKEYNGGVVEGEFVRGAGRQFDTLVRVRKVEIFKEFKGKGERPPGEEAREAIALVEVSEKHPALAADVERIDAERSALEIFVANHKQVVSGLQSVLSAAKELTR